MRPLHPLRRLDLLDQLHPWDLSDLLLPSRHFDQSDPLSLLYLSRPWDQSDLLLPLRR